ncbi:SagB/ThcOx family dehydrogenase [Streptomyces sp. CC224B]|uniref:SagB/ThcOx family dehydrogenase n=1 Tax=Streptomyces sp. CC224B TaxID=3044571 RepID=UPI0024A8C4AA|nr:SagB/ThcOx family dehydrogenase [Streptomyces sp. CC224B]
MHTADVRPEERYRLNPAVRLVPPGSFNNPRWLAVDLVTKRHLAIGRHAAALCVVAAGPTSRAAAVDAVAAHADARKADLATAFDTLLGKDILVAAVTSDRTRWVEQLLSQWRAYGWSEAADHHLMTFDYPFYDYSVDGWTQDRAIMRAYRAEEFDGQRYKTCADGPRPAGDVHPGAAGHPGPGGGVPAPRVTDVLPTLTARFEEATGAPRRAGALDAEVLLRLMSSVFGVLESRGGGPGTAPFVRRTSPSGGARHPSEGYACVFDVPGLAEGWYHYRCGDEALHRVADLDAECARRALFGALRAPFTTRAVLVMTSVFGRNMYRYREPRTFRTLFMDVGHLLTTTEVVAQAMGVAAFGQHGIDDTRVSEVLRLAPEEEAPVLSVALGDGYVARASGAPDGTTAAQDGAAVAEDGAIAAQDGAAVAEDGAIAAQDGAAVAEDSTTAALDRAAAAEDGPSTASPPAPPPPHPASSERR